MKTSKAMTLESTFLILAIVGGIVAFYISSLDAKTSIPDYIGKYQFSIIKSSNEAEKVLLYISQSAKYSLQQAVYDLAQNGGASQADVFETPTPPEEFYENPYSNSCGKYYGYPVWSRKGENNEKISCFDPQQANINLISYFKKNFEEYLSKNPQNIPSDNYDYKIEDSIEIIGKATNLMQFDILKDDSKEIIKEPVKIPKEISKTTEEQESFTGTKLCRKGKKCVLNQEAFDLLKKAQDKAVDKKVSLEVIEGYRSKEDQIRIWKGETSDRYAYFYLTESDRKKVVCYPYGDDVEQRCPHLTGNAVDIFFEGKTKSTMTREDYNLLFSIMSSAGWVRYTKEPWHFECCGTKRYELAKAQGLNEYGEV